jgi:hypothetical protein
MPRERVVDILNLLRSWKDRPAPINRIPPEILSLIPDFLDGPQKNRCVITLTHVCRAWREIFTSRSTLWTDFRCNSASKTKVYLERSKSSPINVSLRRHGSMPPRPLPSGRPPCHRPTQIPVPRRLAGISTRHRQSLMPPRTSP